MSQPNKHFLPLDNQLRLAYLDAMQVSVWALREEQFEAEPVAEKANPQVKANAKIKADSQPDAPTAECINKQPEDSRQPDNEQHKQHATHYLKMVNWKQHQNTQNRLLIICRHETDQPAKSFASSSAPSYLMKDYIQAINQAIPANKPQPEISLAHLTHAALTDECIALASVLQETNPQLILLLGDLAISEMLKISAKVADLRGKVLDFADNSLLVSYHPHSLTQEPKLKKLAMEDIQLVAHCLFATDKVD